MPSKTDKIETTEVEEDKQDLLDLIPKFGTSAATNWVESRYAIWRSPYHTSNAPRVQGYFKSKTRFAIAWGNPLCRDEDLRSVAEEFVSWCEQKHKKPVWAVITAELEAILAAGIPEGKGEFKTLSCIKEDLLHPAEVDLSKKDVKKNRLSAMRAKVMVDEIPVKGPDFVPEPKLKKEIEDGLEAWRTARTGTQIASSALLPWVDGKHRRYFVAKVPGVGVVGVLILAPIKDDSYQVKNSISFPNAPKGTSEDLLGTVIEQMEDEGKHSLTFGASATPDLSPENGFHLGSWRVKLLTRVYKRIVEKNHLAERGQFRAKFDTGDEPLYVAYQPHGFGIEGLTALMLNLRT